MRQCECCAKKQEAVDRLSVRLNEHNEIMDRLKRDRDELMRVRDKLKRDRDKLLKNRLELFGIRNKLWGDRDQLLVNRDELNRNRHELWRNSDELWRNRHEKITRRQEERNRRHDEQHELNEKLTVKLEEGKEINQEKRCQNRAIKMEQDFCEMLNNDPRKNGGQVDKLQTDIKHLKKEMESFQWAFQEAVSKITEELKRAQAGPYQSRQFS